MKFEPLDFGGQSLTLAGDLNTKRFSVGVNESFAAGLLNSSSTRPRSLSASYSNAVFGLA